MLTTPGIAAATLYPANTLVNCAELADVGWVPLAPPGHDSDFSIGINFHVASFTETFDVADGRFVRNDADQAVPATFTATLSRTVRFTFNLSTSLEFQRNLPSKISTSVGFSIEESRTTMIGVSAVVMVPPHSTMLGEYGLRAFDIVYHMQGVGRVRSQNACGTSTEPPVLNQTAHAPTINEGWRFRVV